MKTNFQHNLDEPPEYEELTFSFDLQPVSLQSSSKKREFVKNEIRKVTKLLRYLLSGDVKVEIQWMVYEQERFENPDSPDIDNIIKTILDGLSGPDGVLIDDCQVQSVGSHWIYWNKKEHEINIFIRYIPDDYVRKENLIFVNMGDNLFMPFNSSIPKKHMITIISHLENGIELKNAMLAQTGNYYQAKMFTSVQRVFHKSRVCDSFKCMEKDAFLDILK